MNKIIKEKCEHCQKFIYIGQAVTECNLCNVIIHTRCYEKSKFVFENGTSYCSDCYNDVYEPCYNPYKLYLDHYNKNLYNEDPLEYIDTIQTLSNVLEKCLTFKSIQDVNKSSLLTGPADG